MVSFLKKFRYFFLTLSVLSVVIITLIYWVLSPNVSLPVYNPSDVSEEIVPDTLRHVKKYHRISNFELTDQTGESFGSTQLEGKIHVADFFFTTCPGICPILTRQMKRVQDAFINDNDILIASFSVTPEIDSVPVLQAYAKEKGVISSKWHLLTGDKQTIYNLARTSYLAAKDDSSTPIENDMIHTENFVLVDSKGRIRGFYDGTNTESVDQLIQDVCLLKNDL